MKALILHLILATASSAAWAATPQTTQGTIYVNRGPEVFAIISITGDAAKALYENMKQVEATPDASVPRALNKMGDEISCTKYRQARGKQTAYTCEASVNTNGGFIN